MSQPSALVTQGLGGWSSSSLLVTLGLGISSTPPPTSPPVRAVVCLWRADVQLWAKWGQAMAFQKDLSFYLGEDVTITFSPASPGGPISGWTLEMNVKASPGGTSQFSLSPTISDGPNGIITATVSSSNTSSLAAGVYWYELRRTDSGAVTELTVGNLTLSAR